MQIRTSEGNWKKLGAKARAVRDAVFIDEQGIDEALEHDKCDPHVQHVVLFIEENPIATGRIDENGKIGRVAVLKTYRKQGHGHRVMEALETKARHFGLKKVFVHAQCTVVSFYRQRGYIPLGEETMEAGIPHQYMEKTFIP